MITSCCISSSTVLLIHFSVTVMTVSLSKGFVIYSHAPASIASNIRASCRSAVHTIILALGSRDMISFIAVSPSFSGIKRSIRTRSGLISKYLLTPSFPSTASLTWWPFSLMMLVSIVLVRMVSSTIKTSAIISPSIIIL